jgi:hypothetical protein
MSMRFAPIENPNNRLIGYYTVQKIYPVYEGALRPDYDDALRKRLGTDWTLACQIPIGRTTTDSVDGDVCP